ncbi:hypothetical protein HDV00_003923 [Rhizophlyctis rosea]|nr:hypothetical protein HDV00_003923 [Rhizophlyctis rosea]
MDPKAFIVDEDSLPTTASQCRELFSVDDPASSYILPSILRQNGTIRPSHDKTHPNRSRTNVYFNHYCPEKLCQSMDTVLVFLKYFDSVAMTLTYIGTLHVKPFNWLTHYLPTIRSALGSCGEGERLRFWEDVSKTGVDPIDTDRTCHELTLATGDVQKASDAVLYGDVYGCFAFTDSSNATISKKWQIRSISNHVEVLWRSQVGADITITYGTEQGKYQRAILSRAPYFNSLFNNAFFSKVDQTVSLPDHLNPQAVEAVLQYLYLDDLQSLFRLGNNFSMAVIRVLDFLCMTEEVQVLASSFSFTNCPPETLVDALELATTSSSGKTLLQNVAAFVAGNFAIVHEKDVFSDYILAEQETYWLLMEEIKIQDAIDSDASIKTFRHRLSASRLFGTGFQQQDFSTPAFSTKTKTRQDPSMKTSTSTTPPPSRPINTDNNNGTKTRQDTNTNNDFNTKTINTANDTKTKNPQDPKVKTPSTPTFQHKTTDNANENSTTTQDHQLRQRHQHQDSTPPTTPAPTPSTHPTNVYYRSGQDATDFDISAPRHQHRLPHFSTKITDIATKTAPRLKTRQDPKTRRYRYELHSRRLYLQDQASRRPTTARLLRYDFSPHKHSTSHHDFTTTYFDIRLFLPPRPTLHPTYNFGATYSTYFHIRFSNETIDIAKDGTTPRPFGTRIFDAGNDFNIPTTPGKKTSRRPEMTSALYLWNQDFPATGDDFQYSTPGFKTSRSKTLDDNNDLSNLPARSKTTNLTNVLSLGSSRRHQHHDQHSTPKKQDAINTAFTNLPVRSKTTNLTNVLSLGRSRRHQQPTSTFYPKKQDASDNNFDIYPHKKQDHRQDPKE